VKNVLAAVIAAVEAEGERLRDEFYRAAGPRGQHGNAPVDREIEERLREVLQKLVPAAFAGEETGTTPGTKEGWTWLVDPQDGTFEFTSGRRGSAVSVALLRGGDAVLGVVHSPLSPDRGPDTIAWAEGASAILRNGKPVRASLAGKRIAAGEIVWATGSSSLRPATWSSAVAPARYIAMPSIAYRMARVAVGDGVATVSTHPVNEYDVAAGLALVRAAGGVVLDAEGRDMVLSGSATVRVTGVYAGAPEAARKLAGFQWSLLDEEPRRPQRVALAFPRTRLDAQLARAHGSLLGQVAGDSLGSLVEFKSAREIAALYPDGVRDLADGGVYHTIAGQPTDDSEMALALGRCLVHERAFISDKVLDGYRHWMTTRPIDIGETTERGLLGLHTTESESNGSLMRVSPLGLWAAGEPERAAQAAREDSALTHPNPVCVEACAAYAAAIAVGVGGDAREAMLRAALAEAHGPARDAILRGAGGARPDNYERKQGWVLTALQNAFYRLMHAASLEEALIKTVGCGGDTDTNAAIAGALLGAAYGREAVPERWVKAVLACRPIAEAGAPRPRPMPCWPDDVLELAEALLLSGLER
jgi:ADP-ribosylglycohydrolase/fructose-1,6-bisphosphatase/inositol monophosphatase family enzyme